MVCTVCGNATVRSEKGVDGNDVGWCSVCSTVFDVDGAIIVQPIRSEKASGCDLARRILTHTDHGLIYSDDFGETWTDVAGPPSDSEIHRLLMTDSDTWYVGTVNDELWTTFDSGRTWKLRPYSRGFQHPPST